MVALGTAERAAAAQRYFKTGPGQYGEGDKFIGLTVPDVRTLVREFQALPLPSIVTLLKSPWHEERLLALLILVRQYERGDDAARQAIFACYVGNRGRINNWDLVDCSAPQIVGAHLRGNRRRLRALAKSPSLWDRRIAILATFHEIRAGEFEAALEIAKMLLGDREDLIHKVVGWMLREIGKRDLRTLERFLQAHARHMPRTSLRYAIERFPEPLRRRYLSM